MLNSNLRGTVFLRAYYFNYYGPGIRIIEPNVMNSQLSKEFPASFAVFCPIVSLKRVKAFQ
jgi:hypothetical protein